MDWIFLYGYLVPHRVQGERECELVCVCMYANANEVNAKPSGMSGPLQKQQLKILSYGFRAVDGILCWCGRCY